MVFHKKAATPAKNFQNSAKKGRGKRNQNLDVSGMGSEDDSVDSDDEMQVEKTPNMKKTPKGKLSLSEKKVSFAMQGNAGTKTPNKTPQGAKKQATPASKGKTSMQEFKGMKAIKKEGDEEEDDNEDDDSEDLDDDNDAIEAFVKENLDLSKNSKKSKSNANEVDEDDDDDDDEEMDEDDDDDDDDEEDDEEEMEEEKITIQSKSKQNKPVSPKKDKTNKRENATPSQNLSKKEQKFSQAFLDNKKEKDSKTLFVGKLPKDVKAAELKTLSADIIDVHLPTMERIQRQRGRSIWAFVDFISEAKAEQNFELLQTKKLRDQLISVDYVGEKSLNKKMSAAGVTAQGILQNALFVSNIPVDASIANVAKFFPKATQITFNHSSTTRTATIHFNTDADAAEALKVNCEIGGSKLSTTYCLRSQKKRKFVRRQNKRANDAKRMKLSTNDEDDVDSD